MEQSKFEALTKALVTEGPRRGFLGAIAGGALGVLLGVAPEEAEAGPLARRRRARQRRKKQQQNRCKRVNRRCQPFESGACCSNRCCPALGPKAHTVSVCAPKGTSQCCPAALGGGYCDRDNYRKCCPPTTLSPHGTCCPSVGSSCCVANSVQGRDYCCPEGSHCCNEFLGCCANQPVAAAFGANSAPAPVAAHRRAG